RRLQLERGASAEIKAARVSFPELEIVETKQRYTRISEYRYRYEQHEIRTEFEVDEHGLVVQSEGGWERVAAVTRHD
ncbi:MAG: putative glycolipid-binding domain-containing protein, partial [Anaerolineales bacterium]